MNNKSILNLICVSANHFLVDFVCGYLVFSALVHEQLTPGHFYYLVILYGLLAFGFQPLFGLIIDYLQTPYYFFKLSLITLIIAVIIFYFDPVIGITICALANAMFHVSAGTISLNITPDRTTAPGIFVAPGAIGLFLGIWLGKIYPDHILLLIIAIIIISIFVLNNLPKISINYHEKNIKRNSKYYLILIGLLLVISLRSVIGLSLNYDWKTNIILALILVLFISIGKAVLGIMADRISWLKISVISILLSIPLLYLGKWYPPLAFLGAFFDQVTMPVALVAVSMLWPGRPGWAFGLPCAALIFGGIFTFLAFGKNIFPLLPYLSLIQLIVIYFSLTYFYQLKLKT
jgi:FSR family fosmidomycin resistance protein-like MFS transporter